MLSWHLEISLEIPKKVMLQILTSLEFDWFGVFSHTRRLFSVIYEIAHHWIHKMCLVIHVECTGARPDPFSLVIMSANVHGISPN